MGSLFMYENSLWMVESLFELGYGKYRADTLLKHTKTAGHSRVHCSRMTKPHVLSANSTERAIYVAGQALSTAKEIQKYYLNIDLSKIVVWRGCVSRLGGEER
jgi:hypothetical protein